MRSDVATVTVVGATPIRTLTELMAIGTDAASRAASYILMNDIDTTTGGGPFIARINGDAVADRFTGTFDGKNHTIELNITSTGDRTGLFGAIGIGGTVKNLTVTGSVSGRNYVGGIVGAHNGTGVIENCRSEVAVTGTGTDAGGIAGWSEGIIQNSHATGNITGVTNVGGVVGLNNKISTGSGSLSLVTGCSASGIVTGNNNVGGVAGNNAANSTVSDCEALNSSVTASTGPDIGRVAGFNQGALTNNRANPGMALEVGGTTYIPPVTTDPDSKDGEDI